MENPERTAGFLRPRGGTVERGVASILLVIGLVSAIWSFLGSKTAEDRLAANVELITSSDRLLSTVKDIEIGERGYVLIGSDDYLAPYSASLKLLEGEVSALRTRVERAGADQARTDRIQDLISRRAALAAEIVESQREGSLAVARARIADGRGKDLMDQLRGEVSSLQSAAQGRIEEARSSSRIQTWISAVAFLATLLAAGYFAYAGYLSRRESRHADAMLAEVIDNAPVGLAFVDASQTLVHHNPSFAAVLDQPNVALAGQSLAQIAPDFFAGVRREIDKVLQAPPPKGVQPVEVTLEQADNLKHLAASFFRVGLRNDGVSETGVGVVVTDVTRQKLWEHELETARQMADAANRAKSAFIANMSHELRTPLSAVIGYCELLEDEIIELGEKDLLPDLAKINSNARHLLSLINDVLDLSKIEAEKMEVHAAEFDVKSMLSDVEAATGSLVAKKHNNLVIRSYFLGTIYSDEVKIRQIILNLISNAAKFTENGTITLTFEQAEDPDWVRFSVADTGIGMSQEQLASLFERFVQADASTTRRFGGTGLGLALTKAMTTMLGGLVKVESTEGVGSTFTVEIPTRYEQPEETFEPAEEPSSRPSHLPLILVIDDDPSAREFLARFLTREGYGVETAANGEEGLRKAREMKPLAVLLDVTMPGMDGWNVLRLIRADGDIGETPVLMQTVVDEQSFGYALGANDYLLKPIDRQRLREALSRFAPLEPAGSVLVVDDDEQALERVSSALEREGWSVISCSGGEAALEAMQTQTPSIILVDLLMPGMDGYAFVRAVRDQEAWKDIPIVVLTAEDLSTRRLKTLENATSRILQKGSMPLSDLAADLRRIADQAPASHPSPRL